MSRKRRIGFNARYLREYNLRGFNRYTFCLLKGLRAHSEFEFVLLTDRKSPVHPEFSSRLDAEIIEIPGWKPLAWEQINLPFALKRHDIALFHAPADGGIPVWKSCPYVLTHHRALDKSLTHWVATGELPGRTTDYSPEPAGVVNYYYRKRHLLMRWLYLRRADKIIAVSEYAKWELTELLGVPEDKVVVIYEAADESYTPDVPLFAVQNAKARLGIPDRFFLFVGGFDPWKNVHGLIRAFSEAHRAGVREALVLVGTGGDLQGARDLACQMGLREGVDVVFPGQVLEDLPSLYRGATAFVTASWGESFGLPIVEAMCCGTPVIASNRGAIPEILRAGGLLIDPRNTDSIVQAMKEVSFSIDLRARLSVEALGRSRVFSWKTTADMTATVYQELLVGRPSGTN